MAAQLPDRINIDGDELQLFTNPLEQYWIRHGKRRPYFCGTPSCLRGYIASWEIRDKQVFLTGIDGTVERRSILFGKDRIKYSIKLLFPHHPQRKVKATWFSGKLRIPMGPMTAYTHHDYDSRFEKETLVTVEKGEVIRIVTMDYKRRTLIVNTEIS